MIFKKFFFATLTGTITAAVVGIWMAYRGYGVWALVTQNLVNQLIDTVCLWFTVKWRPNFVFDWKRFKGLFKYGSRLLASGLLDTFYTKLHSLIIGKRYSSSDLAYYNKGSLFPSTVVGNVNSAVLSVLFPAFSEQQESPETVKAMAKRAIKISTYIIMPAMVGIAACAEPMTRIIVMEKWLPSVFFMRIYCTTYAFYVIHSINLNVMKGLGHSDYFFRIEVIKKVVGVTITLITFTISVRAMAYGALVSCFLSQIINSWPNKKLINYSLIEQYVDMLPNILMSCAMGAIVYCVRFLQLGDWATLVIQIVVGVVVYILESIFFKVDSFSYVYGMLRDLLNKKTENAS